MKTSWLKLIRPVVLALFVVVTSASVPAVFAQPFVNQDTGGPKGPSLPPPPPPPPMLGDPPPVSAMKVAGKARHSNYAAPLPTAAGVDIMMIAADIILALL